MPACDERLKYGFHLSVFGQVEAIFSGVENRPGILAAMGKDLNIFLPWGKPPDIAGGIVVNCKYI